MIPHYGLPGPSYVSASNTDRTGVIKGKQSAPGLEKGHVTCSSQCCVSTNQNDLWETVEDVNVCTEFLRLILGALLTRSATLWSNMPVHTVTRAAS